MEISSIKSTSALSDTKKISQSSEHLLYQNREHQSSLNFEHGETIYSRKKEVNTILSVFRAMSIAKNILREGLKETKRSNKIQERRWEEVASKISKQHEDTARSHKSMSRLYYLLPVIQITGVIAGQKFATLSRTQKESARTQLANFPNHFPNRIQWVSRFIPNTILPILDSKNKAKKVEEFASALSTITSTLTQGNLENLKSQNEAEQAPLAMKSQIFTSQYQNRGSEESSEKQQLTEIDRSVRDLMQQESQVFQGSTGRG